MVVLLVVEPLAVLGLVLLVSGTIGWRRYGTVKDLSYTEVRANDLLYRSLDYYRRYFDRNRPTN